MSDTYSKQEIDEWFSRLQDVYGRMQFGFPRVSHEMGPLAQSRV